MLGLFNLFGRSPDLKALDHGLRNAGLHPRTVPEAVKLAAVRQLRDARGGASVPEADFEDAAQLLGFCLLGRDQFIASNGVLEADRAEGRLEAAIAAGDGLDARLLLLALHAGIMAPDVSDRFEVDID